MRIAALALSWLVAVPHVAPAQRTEIQGTVFLDANRNARRDPGERGIPRVAVSNQDAVAQTDSAGAFRIGPSATGVVFVSVPDGYRIVGPFWRRTRDSTATMDFALEQSPSPSTFTFVHASDTHVAPASVERTRRLRAIVDSLKPDFLIVTGDLVRDALRVSAAEATGYYELFRDERSRFATPVWTVPGNHEIFGIERQLSRVDPSHPLFAREMYRHYFGPDYYSFTRGGVHFVGLNTVDIDGESYYGHVDSLQLAWLARDLASIPPSMPVVTFNHIPFVSAVDQVRGFSTDPPAPTLITVNGKTLYRHLVSNALDVLTVVRTRPHVIALGGHLHVRETLFYEIEGVRTLFAQSAAVVAPTQMSPFSFRSGVTVYSVRDGAIDTGRFVPLDGQLAGRR